jgi:hypothetical protein
MIDIQQFNRPGGFHETAGAGDARAKVEAPVHRMLWTFAASLYSAMVHLMWTLCGLETIG